MAGVKMSSLTILSVVLSFVLFVSATDPVPVLLWQSYSSNSLSAPSSALKSLNSAEFSDILLKKITDSKPLLVVFAEKSLSVEDFTWRGSKKESPFSNLEKLYSSAKSKLYIPDVNGPMTALLNLKEHDYKFENVKIDDKITPGGKRIVVVNLDTERPNESRLQMLKRHDKDIADKYNELVSEAPNSKVLAAYTGQSFLWNNGDLTGQSVLRSRVRRAVEADEPTSLTFLNSSNIYLYSPNSIEVSFTSGEKKTFNLTKVAGVLTGDNRKNGGEVRLAAKYTLPDTETLGLTFHFQRADGMWNLSQVSLNYKAEQEDILTPESRIEAPIGFSYHCSKTETFTGKTAVLRLVNPQIQPFAGNDTFGPAADCVYFFTPSILSGLLLTVLLLAITSWGIAMIMGIHTMDRFDDPKGKPLFISASE